MVPFASVDLGGHLIQKKSKNMKVEVTGTLRPGVTAKDIALHVIGVTGTGGGTGVAGDGSIRLEITPTGECGPAAGTLNYVGPRGESKGLGLLKIPFTGSFCTAAAVSVDIEAPEGSTLAGLEVTSMLGGGQFKGASFAFAE